MPIRRLSARGVLVAALACLLCLSLAPSVASAGGDHGHDRGHRRYCEKRNNFTYRKLLGCVTLEGVRQHQQAFQDIADANDGNRSEQTSGYTASVDYVVETMADAGWQVERVPFDYQGSEDVLQLTTPAGEMVDIETGSFTGTAEGSITAGNIVPIDLNLEGDRASTSGCEPEDFTADGIDLSGPDDVALIQRGTCFFADKARNAQDAGAEAVIIFNQGNGEGRMGLIVANASTLSTGEPADLTIPVVGASFPDGELIAAGGTLDLSVTFITITSENVIAELPGRNRDNVVMAGAHLDSVPAGPGVQDNGSGSAVLLEVAESLGRHRPRNTVRFAWWGAEELGLIGSNRYVEELPPEELERIALYLNFDMVGSPNYIFMVYDSDESSFEAPVEVPEGSVAIEDLFESYYTRAGQPYDDSAFSGRSDYQAFINAGIPSGGLFTGAEVIKTDEQQAIWGGVAGDQFDPCYHAACDTFDNVSEDALDVNSDAVAFAVLTYAYSTEDVNGVPGRRVPGYWRIPEPAGPQGTFLDDDGGGGLEPHHFDHLDIVS